MSLIFQTLGKLDAEQTGLDNKENPVSFHQEDAKTQSANSGFRRVLWLSGGIALVLVTLGLGAVLAVHFLSSHEKINPVHAVNTVPEVDRSAQPEQPVDGKSSLASSAPRFVPPDLYDSDALPEQASADKTTISNESTTDTPLLADDDKKITPNEQPMERRDDAIPLEPVHDDSKRATGGAIVVSAVSHDPAISRGKTAAGEQLKTFSGSDALTQEQRRIQAAHRLARQKSERISRIVGKLEAALSQMPDNGANIEVLLSELARAKGENSNYVAKMRAFWLLKQKKFEQAEAILKRIAADGETDPEVGINLAIIDLQKGNRNDALQRLSQLRKTHPENTYIADLLRKLQ